MPDRHVTPVLTAVTTAVLLSLTDKGEPAPHRNLKKATWQAMCSTSTKLGNIANKAAKIVETTAQNLEVVTKQRLKMRIYATSNVSAEQVMKATMLEAFYADRQAAYGSTLGGKTQKNILQATRDNGYLKGRIDEFLDIGSQTKDQAADTEICLHGASKDRNGMKIKDGNTEHCDFTLPNLDTTKIDVKAITTQGVACMSDTEADGNTNLQHTEACVLLAQTNPTLSGAGNLQCDIKFAGGWLKLASNNGQTTVAKVDDLSKGTGAAATIWKAVHSSAHKIISLTGNEDSITNESIGTSDAMYNIVRKAFQITDDDSNTKVKQKLADVYGKPAEAKITDFLKTVDRHTIAQLKPLIATQQTLGEINDVETLNALSIIFENKRGSELAKIDSKNCQQEAKALQQASKEKVCNDIEDKDKCNGSENCAYDDDKSKCVLSVKGKEAEKEGENKEGNEGKTTNTTGSDTFVIKTFPLLLFLLL
ncbi:Trypanosome variant surface glycoprotein (A-type), putative [Trypanosoma equiperdum]|uniref:Trypanosome variant surface glycoprotein (A-type), putative n=1 Tax=Trypanosoma equiperdum TaxID=5694 RepID=A0A1G4HY28_TRYEQ|nr:Trypanosome variant surface glycoprotein (A-type), putative [Trypanosoma equiperdum]